MQRTGYASASRWLLRTRPAAIAAALAWAATGHPRPAHAVSATTITCGVKPATSYDIIRDGVPVTTGASTALGSLAFAMDITSGTLVAIAPLGDLAPPAPPLFTSLAAGLPGCATAAWIQNGDPTVIGYVVGYGPQSVAGGDAPNYEHTMEVGAVGSAEVCSLPLGRHYFAVRAKNVAGMMSGYSGELAVDIVVVSVLFTHFRATAQNDGVHLAWRIEADEAVRGFRVHRSAAGDGQRVLNSELLAPDATHFVDATAQPGVAYTYVLGAERENGDPILSVPVVVMTKPLAFELEPNVPNPFNPSTRIAFTLPEATRAVVRVYDVRGAHVATVLDTRLSAGRHYVDWNGIDDMGSPVGSGMYFYTLAAGKRTQSRKMLLVK